MIKSLIAFIASYSFLFIILFLKNIEFIVETILFHKSYDDKEFWVPTILLLISVIAVSIYIYSIFTVNSDSSKVIVKAKLMRGELINYSIPYMLSFFGFQVSSWIDLATLFFFLFLIFSMQYKEKVTILNPIASFLNFSLYDCEDKYGADFILMAKTKPSLNEDITLKDYGKGIFILKEDYERKPTKDQ